MPYFVNIPLLVTHFLKGDALAAVVLSVEAWLCIVVLRYAYMIWRVLHEMGTPKPIPVYPVTNPNGRRVLILGDSTAYGTGSSNKDDSIAGRLSKDYPHTEIINRAINGSVTANCLPQLHGAPYDMFDLIIVSTGGNDVFYNLTNLDNVRPTLQQLLKECVNKSDHHTVVLFYANFGAARVFPPLLFSLVQRRTDKIHRIFKEVCAEHEVPCVEMFTEDAENGLQATNPFARQPRTYLAKDFMHPSSEGYRLWYNRMWRELHKTDVKL